MSLNEWIFISAVVLQQLLHPVQDNPLEKKLGLRINIMSLQSWIAFMKI
jgi:hypothetical protein